MRYLRTMLLAAATSAIALSAAAQELVIGRANEPQSIDPQFSRTGNNQMTSLHIFDRLILTDANVRPMPGLAVEWEAEDDTTWLVRLREGVTFHDGSPFTAADVVYSLERAPDVPNSPASFAGSVANLASSEIVNDHPIRCSSRISAPSTSSRRRPRKARRTRISTPVKRPSAPVPTSLSAGVRATACNSSATTRTGVTPPHSRR